jgi:NADH-quinone oxidoreductase subunit J
MDHASRAFYGVLLLLTLIALGWGLRAAGGEGMAFALFAVLTLGGGMVCIWERSIVRSAFSLMATFSGVAGLFLLAGADFLAMAQILIYVGGILALLLFGVMLSPPDLGERKLSRVFGSLLLVGGGVAFVGLKARTGLGAARVWAASDELPPIETHAREIGLAFLDPQGYLLAFELAAFFLTVALVAAVYIARRRAVDLEPGSGA